MSARLTLLQYRTLLRIAKHENISALSISSLNRAAIATLCPPTTGLEFFGSTELSQRDTLAKVIRSSFRECAELDDRSSALAAQRRAHHAIQLFSRITHQFRERADRSGIDHHIGQIVLNKQNGIHYVVVGWDRKCRHPSRQYPERSLREGYSQPFYHVLPHRLDTERRRAPLDKAYFPQEHLARSQRPFVSHPKVGDFFDRYCSKSYRFIPKEEMRDQYPDVYPEGDVDLSKYVKLEAEHQARKQAEAARRVEITMASSSSSSSSTSNSSDAERSSDADDAHEEEDALERFANAHHAARNQLPSQSQSHSQSMSNRSNSNRATGSMSMPLEQSEEASLEEALREHDRSRECIEQKEAAAQAAARVAAAAAAAAAVGVSPSEAMRYRGPTRGTSLKQGGHGGLQGMRTVRRVTSSQCASAIVPKAPRRD